MTEILDPSRHEAASVEAISHPWQRILRRDIGWLLLFKLAALLALWALFFSAPHRPRADSAALDRVLAASADATAGDAKTTSGKAP